MGIKRCKTALLFGVYLKLYWLKDTHREKAPSNKTAALTKVRIWAFGQAGTLNQLFIRGS